MHIKARLAIDLFVDFSSACSQEHLPSRGWIINGSKPKTLVDREACEKGTQSDRLALLCTYFLDCQVRRILLITYHDAAPSPCCRFTVTTWAPKQPPPFPGPSSIHSLVSQTSYWVETA